MNELVSPFDHSPNSSPSLWGSSRAGLQWQLPVPHLHSPRPNPRKLPNRLESRKADTPPRQTLLHARPAPRPTLHRPPARRIHKILHLRGPAVRRRNRLPARHRTAFSHFGTQTLSPLPPLHLHPILSNSHVAEKKIFSAKESSTTDNEYDTEQDIL
jgi:hypothetical protein